MRCLATSTLVLAKRSAQAIGTEDLKNSIRDMRADPVFNQALDSDLQASEDSLVDLLYEAIEAGVEAEMAHQVTRIRGLKYKTTDADRQLMAGYPIQGHTAAEMSASMHQQLRYEVIGVVAQGACGDAELRGMPQILGGTVQRFADRVAVAIEEAYYAGTQLATRMTAQAVTNAG